MDPMKKTLHAFTLIELLLVIAVIAILVSLISSALWKAKQNALTNRTLTDIRAMEQAIRMYRVEYERWPGALPPSGLSENRTWESDNQNLVKYLVPSNPIPPFTVDLNPRRRAFWEKEGTNLLFRDSWGSPYSITIDISNDVIRVTSPGPDKNLNTTADNINL
jgi:general secretion pathway protein G